MADPSLFRSPFDELVGTRVVAASGDGVVATLDVGSRHHQPTGIVHGGLYATLVETTVSVGASLWLGEDGVAVGVSNHTDFLRSHSQGRLRVEALPLQRGRTLQLWRAEVTDVEGRLVACGNVRLANMRT
ncbi:MAG: PaaI family thioesterase [Acidimicrobiia bacterium]|jgi:uncharacterized protein (TIGR00369 family)|nr:PaaI family thioesterase [Acidimicrobiia bacterium]